MRNEAVLPYGPEPNSKEKESRDSVLKDFWMSFVGDVTEITNQI